MKDELLIAIYSRKSKITGKGESIENQIELCKEYIKMHFGTEAIKRISVYEDEGFSGGNLERPDFKRMMTDANDKRIESIIVYRLDRISRNISDFSMLINKLNSMNISFISIKEQFDTSTPMGRAMMYISSVFSQLERETIAERIKDNMFELSKTGIWLGGVTPTGYKSRRIDKILSNGNTKSFYTLEKVPQETHIVKLIFDLYLRFNSLVKVEDELKQLNIKTKNNKDFTRFSIKAILKNPVYAIADKDIFDYFTRNNAIVSSNAKDFNGFYGVMPYNRTRQRKGKAAVVQPVREWVIAVGLHDGLINGKDWVKTQETLNKRIRKSDYTF